MNPLILSDLASGVSMRRCALKQNLNKKTVVRKFLVIGKFCEELLRRDLENYPASQSVEFDDLEAFEHTKLKPISVLAMIESKTRRILGFIVVRMPAKGKLAARSRQKYGKRQDERKAGRNQLFAELKFYISPNATLKSDMNPHYPPDVAKHFPHAAHQATKGRRGCVVGQGELKRGGRDPLFTLNHTFAMFRDNIKRLARRTWCTTKKLERLQLHLALYAIYHNWLLIQKNKTPPPSA